MFTTAEKLAARDELRLCGIPECQLDGALADALEAAEGRV